MLSKHSLTSYKCYPKRLIYKKKNLPRLPGADGSESGIDSNDAENEANLSDQRMPPPPGFEGICNFFTTALLLLYYC
jgi:hypothetical protein